jgi:hypothetical protein
MPNVARRIACMDYDVALLQRVSRPALTHESVRTAELEGPFGSRVAAGRLKVIASIEEPELIERILAHRRERGEEAAPMAALGARAPPQGSLF